MAAVGLWRRKFLFYVGNKTGGIIFLFGLVLLAFLWSGLLYKVNSEKQQELDNAFKETDNLVRAFEEHSLRTLEGLDRAALFLKLQYEKEGASVDIPYYVNNGILSDSSILLTSVIDEKGELVASSQQPLPVMNLSDREHFLVHRDSDSKQLFISKTVLGRASGKWSIQLTRRVNKPDGAFGGAVVISVDPFYFTRFYGQMDLGDHSVISLVGDDGIVRARQSDETATFGQDLTGSILLDQMMDKRQGHYINTSVVDGTERLYSFRAIKHYPLAVLVGIDKAAALSAFSKREAGYYRAAVAASLVIILFMLILIRNIRKQYRAEAALQQAHDEMERQVQIRTHELRMSNQRLKEEIGERARVAEKLQKQTEESYRLAYSDALTGLGNRTAVMAWLDAAMLRAQAGEAYGAVVYIDLDDLKTVNDTYGHPYGDGIIVEAAARIEKTAGPNSIVGRIGGDEFIVILPDRADRKRLENGIVAQLTAVLSEEYEVQGERFSLSASLGIAVYPKDGDTSEEILKNADNAMYAAKHAGKNGWRFYEAAMQEDAFQKMVLNNNLRRAIERGELSLHYQPQVSLQTDTIVGFEALLRWSNEENGFVPPQVFIPLAEQSGLILALGAWVLKEACLFAGRLAQSGRERLYVAVNVSPRQLAASDFVELVRETLRETNIRPQQLELEITESALLHSVEEATQTLKQLQGLGVRLSLDDFGTGYSSLTYLRQLPVETLKIDKSFIDIIGVDDNAAQIIGAMADMAHILRMTVVAEGVETEQQLRYLAANGCDCVQGYFFSRPLPEKEALEKLLANEGRINGPSRII